jgi:hypothetical protein
MKGSTVLFLALLVVIVVSEIPHFTKKQIMDKIDSTKINYGTTIRIRANAFAY